MKEEVKKESLITLSELKRWFSLLFVIIVLLFASSAFADEDPPVTCGDWSYFLYYNDHCDLFMYNGTDCFVSVPGELDGYRVSEIGRDTFVSGRFRILSITLPDGLENINENAFRHLNFLIHLTIPASSVDAALNALAVCPKDLWVTLRYGENEIQTTAGQVRKLDGRNKTIFWGSYTADKTYSFDRRFYAVQTIGQMTGSLIDRTKVTIYRTDTDRQIAVFMPTFADAFWGMCWEKDSYNLWIQSSFTEYPIWQYPNWLLQGEKPKEGDDWVLSNPEQQKPAYTCYRYMNDTWIPDEAAECPSYIVSRYDRTAMNDPGSWETIYESPTVK